MKTIFVALVKRKKGKAGENERRCRIMVKALCITLGAFLGLCTIGLVWIALQLLESVKETIDSIFRKLL